MHTTRCLLLAGVGVGLLAVGAGALAAPRGFREISGDAGQIVVLALLPVCAMVCARAGGRGWAPTGRSAAGLVPAACLLAVGLTAAAALTWATAAGPIAALVAFGCIALLGAFSWPGRDRALALVPDLADPVGADAPTAQESSCARAA